MSNPYNLKQGQKLWYVPNRRHSEPYEVTVNKVGTKYFMVKEESWTRFHNDSLRRDSDFCNDHCYLSKEAYEAEVGLSIAWREFQRSVERGRASGELITIENIGLARKLLGLEEVTQ